MFSSATRALLLAPCLLALGFGPALTGDGVILTALGPDGPSSSPDASVLVDIAGPVSRIVIEHSQDGPDNTGIDVTDIYFDVETDGQGSGTGGSGTSGCGSTSYHNGGVEGDEFDSWYDDNLSGHYGGSGSGGMGDSQLEVYAVEPERLRLHATIHTGALRFVNDFIGESYTHALYTLRYWHASELVGARCIRMGPLVREQVALDFTFFPLAEQPAPVRSLERALPIVASSDGSIEADRTSIDDVDIVNGARLPVLRTTGVYVLTAEGVELMARDVVDVDAACASAP